MTAHLPAPSPAPVPGQTELHVITWTMRAVRRPRWFAVCSCGWRSPEVRTVADVLTAAETHLAAEWADWDDG